MLVAILGQTVQLDLDQKSALLERLLMLADIKSVFFLKDDRKVDFIALAVVPGESALQALEDIIEDNHDVYSAQGYRVVICGPAVETG